ncbi:MAG: sterol desaturase family protein [Saprospiraceae bacterium]
MPDLPNIQLVHYAIPFFVVLLLLEVGVGAYERKDWYDGKDTAGSLTMGIGNVLAGFAVKFVQVAALFFVYRYRLFEIGSAWYVWLLLFFLDDFTAYWNHRISHESRFFWASHVVHHSSKRYNLGTALRQTWTTIITSNGVFWLWLPLLGFHPLMIVILGSVNLIYQFWIHTEAIGKLWRPIEYVFNTPSHHRVHHSSDLKYLDRNHGNILIIWDRLFGTFQEEEEQPRYGLVHDIDSHNPLVIATHEWRDLLRDQWQPLTLRERLLYVFGPPGYSHDGSRQTTREMRAAQGGAEEQ